jgi:hypothetical protein
MRSISKAKWICVLVFAVLALPGALSAGVRAESDGGISLEALQDPVNGWQPVAKGVWRRSTPDGRTETYTQGREGLAFVLPTLRTHLAELVEAFLEQPDSERYDAMGEYSRFIEKVEKAVGGAAPGRQGASTKTSCQYSFNYGADAFPSMACRNNATANASYSATSSGERCAKCDVYAYAYVERTCSGTTTSQSQSCTDSGNPASCAASASLNTAASSCFAYAFASIFCADLNNLYLSTFDTDTGCGSGLCLFCGQLEPNP